MTSIITLIKGKATRKHSLHGKTVALAAGFVEAVHQW